MNSPCNYLDINGEYVFLWHYISTTLSEIYHGNFIGAPVVGFQAVMADFREGSLGTDAAAANSHGMAGIVTNACPPRYQSRDEARQATQDFVDDRIDRYNEQRRWWNPFAGSRALGEAYHAVQDSHAHGHGYQEWPGGWPSIGHFLSDTLDAPPFWDTQKTRKKGGLAK